MATINGTSGADNLSGSTDADVFNLGQGGADTVKGLYGDDTFNMGRALTAADRIDGGSGGLDNDRVVLEGAYGGGLRFQSATISEIERVVLTEGFSYNLTFHDGNVAASRHLLVDGYSLGAGSRLKLDGSAEVDGAFRFYAGGDASTIIGGAGDDTMYGGEGSDLFIGGSGDDYFDIDDIGGAGSDRVRGGLGADLVLVGNLIGPGDRLDGGGGSEDVVVFSGEHRTPILLSGQTLSNFEHIKFNSYSRALDLTVDDGVAAAGRQLTLDLDGSNGTLLGGRVSLDASAESDAYLHMSGGDFDDRIVGGARADTLSGREGDDRLTGGGGSDVFFGDGGADRYIYLDIADSTPTAPDTLNSAEGDIIDVRAIDANLHRDGNQAFRMVESFSGKAGQAVFGFGDVDGRLELALDVDGDAQADAVIWLFDDDDSFDNFVL